MIVRILKSPSINLYVIARYEGNNGATFQVLDEETWTPYLLKANEVELIDNTIPSRWIETRLNEKTVMTFPEFAGAGFWEKYFDNNTDALSSFDKVIIPLSKIAIACSHIEEPSKFTWANVLFLLQKKWCPISTAIDLATIRVFNGGENIEELELSGMHCRETDEVVKLVSELAKSDLVNRSQLFSAAMRWLKSLPQADTEIFIRRFEKEIKWGSQNQ